MRRCEEEEISQMPISLLPYGVKGILGCMREMLWLFKVWDFILQSIEMLSLFKITEHDAGDPTKKIFLLFDM
jgi:hypothetical protein